MTDRNQLARTVRQLPSIVALGELWQQRTDDGESDQDYWAFMEWLDKGSKRGAVPSKFLALAERFEWAERALAYERAHEIQRGIDEGHTTPEAQITDNLTRMCQIEVQKLFKQSASSSQPVVGLKDLLATINTLQGFHEASNKAAASKVDLSQFTEEQVRLILKAQRLLKDAGGKKTT